MIDFQRDFCERGGYADRCGGIDWVAPILPAARRLRDAARAAGDHRHRQRDRLRVDLDDRSATDHRRQRRRSEIVRRAFACSLPATGSALICRAVNFRSILNLWTLRSTPRGAARYQRPSSPQTGMPQDVQHFGSDELKQRYSPNADAGIRSRHVLRNHQTARRNLADVSG